jgi:hypothetical protein
MACRKGGKIRETPKWRTNKQNIEVADELSKSCTEKHRSLD